MPVQHTAIRPKRLQTENQRVRQAALQASAVATTVLLGGTVGYHTIEHWTWLESLYMTVITLATIGFGETHPLSDVGRMFTIGLILIGVGNLGYALAEMTAFFATGGFAAYRRRERMERMLAEMTEHTIICGCGRLGSAVIEELLARDMPFVVVDRDPKAVEKLHLQAEIALIVGDANDDLVLEQAGIHRARTLVAALSDDAHNVFLTLSARVMTRESNPALVIHGKAEDPTTLVKLQRAGATHAFSPSRVLGHRIAHQIVRPAITELVGLTGNGGNFDLGIEELPAEHIGAIGRSLRALPLWGQPDLLVLAIKTADGTIVFPPTPDRELSPGDRVVVLGNPDRFAALTAIRK